MIKKDATNPAKLKANAAECRAMIRFGAALAKEFHNGDPHRLTVAHIMNHGEVGWPQQGAKRGGANNPSQVS
jgi:hypothetical protein